MNHIVSISSLVLTAQGMNPEAKKICAQTHHPHRCESTVGPHVKGRPITILRLHMKADLNVTEQAIEKAEQAMSVHSTKAIIVESYSYQVCLKNYDSAILDWTRPLADLKARKANELATHLSAVNSFVANCENAFTNNDPTVQIMSPLAGFNGDITKCITDCFDLQKVYLP